MRNQRISGCHRKQRRAKRRCIRQNQRYSKQSGGILSKLRDRRGNKADDDQRYTERNNLPKNIIQRHNEIHKTFICYKTGNNTDRYTQRQPKRQAFHQLSHTHSSFLIPTSSFLLFPKFFRIQTAVLHPLDRICHHLLIFLVGHAVPAVHAL